MRHRATVPGMLLSFAGFYSATCFIAPKWAHGAGLDFWNHAKIVALVRAEEGRNQDLESEMDQLQRRDAACDQIAMGVCERRISLLDALGDVAALAESAPRWWARLRFQYRFEGLPPSAPDREGFTFLLRRRIELLGTRAKNSGDAARVSLVAERLTSFDEEVRELDGEGVFAQAKP